MAQKLISVPTKDGLVDFLPMPNGSEVVETDAGMFLLLPEETELVEILDGEKIKP